MADPSSSAAPLTTAERNAQEAVREQGLCGAIGNGRVCIRDPHRGPHGFETMPEPDTAACPACFMERHDGHDIGLRHEDGSLYSATCHDCGETYQRATKPMREFIKQVAE